VCVEGGEGVGCGRGVGMAARSVDDPIRVILTLRDDFLVRAEQLPPFQQRISQGLHLLTTPSPTDLERILIEPARRAGYSFDDPALAGEMVAAVAPQPRALALLSFPGVKLWEQRDRHFHKLHRKAYDAMGGVGGALASHAEAFLAQIMPEERRLVREAFRRLVTSEGTREVLARRELAQVLGGEAQAGAVIRKLIDARLLVSSEGEGSEPLVEIIHEALL